MIDNLKKIDENLNHDQLYNKFDAFYDGSINIDDLMNYFDLDEFGEFVNYCRQECDLDVNVEQFDNYQQAINELSEINTYHDLYSVPIDFVFNYFSIDELEGLWNFIKLEYDYQDNFNESKKIEEAINSKGRYTLNFGNWRSGNGLSFASKNDLISWLRSNYIDLETKITYSEDVTNIFKNVMHKISHSDIKNKDDSKKLFDKGYVSIKDTKENDNDLEEATCGVGGAYTTKSIDILPK